VEKARVEHLKGDSLG
jgi:hypothetical protein